MLFQNSYLQKIRQVPGWKEQYFKLQSYQVVEAKFYFLTPCGLALYYIIFLTSNEAFATKQHQQPIERGMRATVEQLKRWLI